MLLLYLIPNFSPVRKQETQALSDLLSEFLRDNNLEQPFLESKILEAWPTVLGPTVARYTGKMNITNGVLFVHVQSAPLRQELFNCRFQLVERLNAAVGATSVIKDIRLLG